MIPVILAAGILCSWFGLWCDDGFVPDNKGNDWEGVTYQDVSYESVGFAKGIVEMIKPDGIIMKGETFKVINDTREIPIGSIVTLEGFNDIWKCYTGALRFDNGTFVSKIKQPELFDELYKRPNEMHDCYISKDVNYDYYLRGIEIQKQQNVSRVTGN